jgi:P27 family predicted phage terminase small subunit
METAMSRVIPYETHRLRGFPGKRKLRPGPQPTRTEEVPEPPDFLCEAAKAEWRRLAPELCRLNLLTTLDRSLFAVYCETFGHWMEAERQLEAGGLVAKGSTGNVVMHPLVKIAVQAARDVCKFGAEFGLSPCARAKMRAGYSPPPGGSKFDGLLSDGS